MLSFGKRLWARHGKSILVLVRIAVSASILALIARSIDIGLAWRAASGARPEWLLAALLMQLASTTIAAWRWQCIMRNLDFGQSFAFYRDSYFKGMFFSQVLPTGIGGDAIRVLDVARRGFRKRDALAGIAIDRITGLGALLLLSLATHLIDPDLLPEQAYRTIVWLLAAGVLAFLGLAVARRFAGRRGDRVSHVLKRIADRVVQALARQRFVLAASSLLVPSFAMLAFLALGNALGLQYDLLTYFAIVPPALVLTTVPVSIAGWGVREGVLVGLFSLLGANDAVVLTMSLMYGIVLIAVSLPGLAVFLRGRRKLPPTPGAEAMAGMRAGEIEAMIAPRWRVRGLVACNAIALLLLASWRWPPARTWWDQADLFVFQAANALIAAGAGWAQFWALGNSRYADVPVGLVLLAVLAGGNAASAPHRVRQVLYAFLAALLLLLLVRAGPMAELVRAMDWQRASPTLEVAGALRLSEMFPDWVARWGLKDASGRSFPGDHASVLLLWALCVTAFRHGRRALFAWLLAALFMLPRLVSGAHWLSDAAVGGSFVALMAFGWCFCTPYAARACALMERFLTPVLLALGKLPGLDRVKLFSPA
jgi:uncharacterized protein (TIRG00374 family)